MNTIKPLNYIIKFSLDDTSYPELRLSSSRVGNEGYLEHAIPLINQHLAKISQVGL